MFSRSRGDPFSSTGSTSSRIVVVEDEEGGRDTFSHISTRQPRRGDATNAHQESTFQGNDAARHNQKLPWLHSGSRVTTRRGLGPRLEYKDENEGKQPLHPPLDNARTSFNYGPTRQRDLCCLRHDGRIACFCIKIEKLYFRFEISSNMFYR